MSRGRAGPDLGVRDSDSLYNVFLRLREDGTRILPFMSAVQWRSLSSRLGSGLDGGPVGLVWREPVPAALEQPLRLWVHHTLTGTSFQTPSGPRRGIYRQW